MAWHANGVWCGIGWDGVGWRETSRESDHVPLRFVFILTHFASSRVSAWRKGDFHTSALRQTNRRKEREKKLTVKETSTLESSNDVSRSSLASCKKDTRLVLCAPHRHLRNQSGLMPRLVVRVELT